MIALTASDPSFSAGYWSAAIVGAVFVYAGMQKVQDKPRWEAEAAALGVKQNFARPLPWLETLIGASMILGGVAGLMRLVALALLAAFTAVIIGNLRRGNRPPCACFGSRRPTPISWWTVVRNMALMALIVFALLVT